LLLKGIKDMFSSFAGHIFLFCEEFSSLIDASAYGVVITFLYKEHSCKEKQ